MNDRIRCVAIDDEPLALEIIEKFCQRVGNVELQKFCDPTEGLDAVKRDTPDIVFLDIEMDGVNGLQIATQLPENTCFIFTTAYLRYALEGFDLDAVDYLHKPFSYNRFKTAFAKALRRIGCGQLQTVQQCVTVKQDYSNISIPIDDILYRGCGGIFKNFQGNGGLHPVAYSAEKYVCAIATRPHFLRIHRSFIVSRSKIKSFSRQEVVLSDGTALPIGRQYAAEIANIMS